jgi:hypothetical protein
MRGNGKRWIVLGVIGLVFGVLGACGGDDDDDGGGAGAGSKKGETCASPGFTETGCLCGNGAVGRRTCNKDAIWEECKCPPVNEMCVEGRDVQCNPCPGETKGKVVKCLQAGTFDCGCQ